MGPEDQQFARLDLRRRSGTMKGTGKRCVRDGGREGTMGGKSLRKGLVGCISRGRMTGR